MNVEKLRVTKHLMERFMERFGHIHDVNYDAKLHDYILNLIRDGEDNKSFLNNPRYMDYLYDKYGYHCRYNFVVNGKVVFVIKDDGISTFAVTCLESDFTPFMTSHNKFKKPKKKEIIDETPVDMAPDVDSLLKSIKTKKQLRKERLEKEKLQKEREYKK